jgi:membrane protein
LFARQLNEWYHFVNQMSGGRLNIIKHALKTFSVTNASQAAAALAYYAIFSLFPLLLLSIVGGSYFISTQEIYFRVTQLVYRVIPVSAQLIDENLSEVLKSREAVGIFSLATLIWSASGVFTNLAYNINLAWPKASRRNFLANRLVGLGMIGGLSLLLILSVAVDWVIKLAPFLNYWSATSSSGRLWGLISDFGTWLMIFFLFLALYRWIPTSRVRWGATIWGALAASLGWKAATAGFAWYLKSGLGRYQVVYGSLGAIVTMLFLIFLVADITLFGAHLSAAIDLWEKNKDPEPEKTALERSQPGVE